jgi:hypothetical protein
VTAGDKNNNGFEAILNNEDGVSLNAVSLTKFLDPRDTTHEKRPQRCVRQNADMFVKRV